jgi:hypothetical protein
MHPGYVERSLVAQGLYLRLGSLIQQRPWFPTRLERASLVADALPSWAVASGITAGWVWTGMGHPEPWSVLREEKPGLSPLERTHWQARMRTTTHQVTSLMGLRLLNPASTVREILLSAHTIDTCATQVMFLSSATLKQLTSECYAHRASVVSRQHARAVLHRLQDLRTRYPDITR